VTSGQLGFGGCRVSIEDENMVSQSSFLNQTLTDPVPHSPELTAMDGDIAVADVPLSLVAHVGNRPVSHPDPDPVVGC